MIALLLAAALTPPPVPGDDRTAIIATVKTLLDGLTHGDRAGVAKVLEGECSFVALDRRNPDKPRERVTSFAGILAELKPEDVKLVEKIGTPTITQRGDIAQVWAPYAFAVNRKPTHCGIDAFHLVRRGGMWRISGLIYTVEPLTACAALGSPAVAGR